jgi:hypothetical protein
MDQLSNQLKLAPQLTGNPKDMLQAGQQPLQMASDPSMINKQVNEIDYDQSNDGISQFKPQQPKKTQ